MNKEVNFFIFLFFFLGFKSFKAQNIPPVSKFTPAIYNADNQNWSITQAQDKTMFFANSRGLLKYDGERWELLGSINNTILRSVYAIDNDIYTGAYMEFGVWKENKFGKYIYQSLSNTLELVEDEQFWNIAAINEYIVFQSLDAIYLYNLDTEDFEVISSKSEITKIVELNNILYYHKKNEGLFKLINGKEEAVNTTDIFKNSTLINMYTIDNHTYAQMQFNGIINIEDNSRFFPLNRPDLFNDISVYNSLQIDNGDIYLGTISKGLIKISNGQVNFELNQNNAISNNTVLSLFQDNHKNIWLGLDNGINCVDFTSSVTIFNDNDGNLGTIYDTIEFEDTLYLGTNQGLFYFDSLAKSYKLIEGTKGQVWNLFSHGQTLLCGHHNGTYEIINKQARLIEGARGTWMFRVIDQNNILSGNYEGLHVYSKVNGNWKHLRKIKGFNISAKYFEFIDASNILVNHEYKGIYKLKLDNTLSEVLSVAKDNSVDKGLFSSIVKLEDKIFYAYENGIYVYDKRQSKFKKDSVLSRLYENNYTSGRLEKTDDNKVWVFTKTDLSYFTLGSLKNEYILKKFPISAESRNQISGYENITQISQNSYLLGKNDGFIRIENVNNIKVKPEVSISKIIVKNMDEDVKLEVKKAQIQTYENQFNHVSFLLTAYNHNPLFKSEYQYKLSGYSEEWSSWSEKSEVYYENLPYGNYEFKVRSRIGQDNYSDIKSHSFAISKPFYLSDLMIVVYVLTLIILFIAIHVAYKQYYKRKKNELQRLADRKLEINELESQRKIMKVKNDKLRLDVENKNRELAISTMSLIRKNEFLSKIKSDLRPIQSHEKIVKRVISVIDKNIDNNEDWELFEEAFNNADKDFFKKLKEMHPALTHNDFKLCAYLRLNLSSKEIAPLFNISPKSVEIKRYRLRKKMDLDRNQSLTDYILSI